MVIRQPSANRPRIRDHEVSFTCLLRATPHRRTAGPRHEGIDRPRARPARLRTGLLPRLEQAPARELRRAWPRTADWEPTRRKLRLSPFCTTSTVVERAAQPGRLSQSQSST